MRIERIEIRVTDLKTRLQRQRSTGPYDTGDPATLLGKPVLVRLFAEGIVGYGRIRPLAPHHAMPDTCATIVSMIKDLCGARLIGQRIFDVEGIRCLFDALAPANYMARAGLDAALYGAIGKAVGQPVYNLIGGLNRPRLPLEWSISMAPDAKKLVADAERALHECGINTPPDGWKQDAKHFRMIREAVGEDVVIGMDPNTSWTVTDTLKARRALQDHRVDSVEQPVKRHDLAGMAAIRCAAAGVPLMADESCMSIQDARAIVAAEAADVLCIKLYKHGGITPPRQVAAIAEAANLKINCGGLAVLTQLEAAAGAYFYASRPAAGIMPAGEFIFGPGVIGPDPLVPQTDFVAKDGHVTPPSGPGFGITVDETALDRLTLLEETVQ